MVTNVTMVALINEFPMVTMIAIVVFVILFTSVEGTCEIFRVHAMGEVEVEVYSFLT